MDLPHVVPSAGNPLGALFACHEDLGVSAPAAEVAAELVGARPLIRVFIPTEAVPVPGSPSASVLAWAASQVDGHLVAAHHGRVWFPPQWLPAPQAQNLLLFALSAGCDPEEEHAAFMDGLLELEEYCSVDDLWSSSDDDVRRRLASAIRDGDCSGLRFVSSSFDAPATIVTDEVSACDGVEGVFDLLCAEVSEFLLSGYEFALTVGYWVPLLRFLGERDSDHRALLAANVCAVPTLPACRMLEILDDVRSGRLTHPV